MCGAGQVVLAMRKTAQGGAVKGRADRSIGSPLSPFSILLPASTVRICFSFSVCSSTGKIHSSPRISGRKIVKDCINDGFLNTSSKNFSSSSLVLFKKLPVALEKQPVAAAQRG